MPCMADSGRRLSDTTSMVTAATQPRRLRRDRRTYSAGRLFRNARTDPLAVRRCLSRQADPVRARPRAAVLRGRLAAGNRCAAQRAVLPGAAPALRHRRADVRPGDDRRRRRTAGRGGDRGGTAGGRTDGRREPRPCDSRHHVRAQQRGVRPDLPRWPRRRCCSPESASRFGRPRWVPRSIAAPHTCAASAT